MKKIRPIKSTWYEWLINIILYPVRKSVGNFKDKIVSLFNIDTHKLAVYGRGKKLSKPKTQRQPEQSKTNSIRCSFILKKKKIYRYNK